MKAKLNIKILLTLLILAAFLIPMSENANAKSKTDYQLMKQTVKENYGNKKIKLINGNGDEDAYWNVILHRKNKKYVVVEKVISKGNGTKHGWYKTANGNKYIIGYNKKVPKGKKVTSYIIWNPYSNECDVIDFVIDNGKVR